MEVTEGELKCKSSADANPSTINSKSRNMSANDLGHKMDAGKKRGVYVVKWVDPKHAEDKKSNPKSKAQPTSQPQTTSQPPTQKLLTSAPAASKIFTYTRLLGTADPVVRFIKRKPKKIPSDKLPKQSSKISSLHDTKPSKHDMPKNIEENKKLKKIRSNAHKFQRKDTETDTIFKSTKEEVSVSPSTSNIAHNKSYEATWSTIFPKESNLGNAHLLQEYVCNYEQTVVKTNNEEVDEKPAKELDKEEPIYDFFIDLLESVYDDDVANNPDLLTKSPDITFEVDDQVAQKLEKQEQSPKQQTIRRDITYDQSWQLADYYNKSRFIPLIPEQRKKKSNKNNKPTISKGKPIKTNLLTLLKQQLSLDFNTYQEPETMHEALLNIARNKRKRKQIYFEDDMYSDDKLCSLKRRNVLSTKTQRKQLKPRNNNYINSTTARYRTGSDISKIPESSYSLEVLGYDYDEADIVEPDTDYSGFGINMELANRLNAIRRITDFNEGITTVTKHWKD